MKYLFLLLSTIPLLGWAQEDEWAQVSIKVNPVSEKIAFLEGKGGNIGVIHGDDGVMIIDDQYAPLSDKILSAIAELSTGNLKFIVNTHYHGDHTGGNENLSADGAMVVAHEKVRDRLGTTFYSALWERDVEAQPASYWPVITFSKDMTFHFNDEAVKVIYAPNAHTDGDAIVLFANSNVMHTGDVFVRYGFPFIDIAAGGTIDGFIDAQDLILSLVNEKTKIIPGHGKLCGIEEVIKMKAMLTETRGIVADLKKSGFTLDEVLSKNPLEPYTEQWNGNFINTQLFTRLIFETLPD